MPAGTDILVALGLSAEVAGLSHEREIADGVNRRRLPRPLVDTTRLTGAEIDAAIAYRTAAGTPIYDIDADGLSALRPDLILTQGLCVLLPIVCVAPTGSAD